MESVENWKPVPSWGGLYEASSHGQIRRTGKDLPLKLLDTKHSRYLMVTLSRNGKCKPQFVHRLVAEAFHGAPPENTECRHLNGEPKDNRAENVCWGSKSDNTLDQVAHGTHHHVRKTHCPRGHEYSAENTYTQPSKPNARRCRVCAKITFDAWATKNAGYYRNRRKKTA